MTGARRSGARRFGLALAAALIALVAGDIHVQAQGMGGMGGMGGGMGGMGAPGGGNPLAPASVGGTNGAGAPESSGAGRRSTVVLSPDAEKVIDVRVVGNRTVPLQKIAKNIMTRADRPFSQQLLEEDVRALHKTKLFVNVETKVQRAATGGVIVIFQVVERQSLAYVKYVGNTVRLKSLEKQTNLKAGDPIDAFMISDAAGKLESWYHTKGFTKAKVTVIEGSKIGDRGAIFLINEGQKQRVWEVKFEGNTVASDGRLKTQIKSKPPILFMFKGEVDREKIDQDVDRLQTYYRSLGYFNARIGRELEFNEKENWLTLTFVIDEGQRYRVRDITVIGNSKLQTENLLKDLKLKSGDYFDQSAADGDLLKIQDKYGSTGYVFAAVAPELRFDEQPGQLDLVYQVQEGARYHIGRIEVHINGEHPRTRRHTVMNRISLQPGQIADIRELRDSERRLKGSGLFQNNPAQGNPPSVRFVRPELEGLTQDDSASSGGDRTASGGRGQGGRHSRGFRGQSPDNVGPQAWNVDPRVAPSDPIDVIIDLWLTPEQLAELDRLEQREPRHAEQPLVVRAQSPGDYSIGGGGNTGVGLSYGQPNPSYSPAPPGQSWAAVGVGGAQPRPTGPDTNFSNQSFSPYAPPEPTQVGGTRVALQPAPGYTNLQPVQSGPPPGAYAPAAPPIGNGAFGAPAYNSTPVQGGPSQMFGGPGAVYQPSAPATPGVPVQPFNPGAPAAITGPPATGVLPPPQNGYDNFGQVVPRPEGITPGSLDPIAEPTQPVTVIATATETQTGRFMAGVGVNSSSGLVGNIVLEEQNFDWRRWPSSWEELRNGTAFRGAGQQFRLEAIPGTQVSRYSATFREPYLWDTNISFGLSAFYYQRFFLNWTEQRTGGNVRFGKQLTPDLQASFTLRAEDVYLSNPTVPTPPQLAAALGSNGLYTARWDLIHDTRDSPFLPTQGHYVDLGFEQAFGTYVFSRGTIDARRHFMLRERPDHSGRHVLNLYTNVGFTGDNTPIFENFFAGGIPTLRGFQFRGASPQVENVQVGGHFQWLNTVEYMFPLTPDDMLRGVAFCDFGTVEVDTRLAWQTFRVSPGLGLRISLPAMGPAPIALDFAVPVNFAPGDSLQLFSFMVGAGR